MSYTNLNYHLITGAKDRRQFIRPEILPRLVKYVGGIIRNLRGTMIEANGPEDHFHIVAILNPAMSVSDVMRDIKSNATAWVRDTFADMADFAWQDGFSAFSVSHSQLDAVVKYVQSQQEHHRKMTFEEELTLLLKKHHVAYDPRYLLG